MEKTTYQIKGEIPVREFITIHNNNKKTSNKAIYHTKDIFYEKYKDRKFLLEVCEDNDYINVTEISESDNPLNNTEIDRLINTFLLNGETHMGIDSKQILSHVSFESAFEHVDSQYYLVTRDTKNVMELFAEAVMMDEPVGDEEVVMPDSFYEMMKMIETEEEENVSEEEEPMVVSHQRDESLYQDAVNDNYYKKYLDNTIIKETTDNNSKLKEEMESEVIKLTDELLEISHSIKRDTDLMSSISSKLDTLKGRLIYMEEDKPKNGYYISMIHAGKSEKIDTETLDYISNKLRVFGKTLNVDALMNVLKSNSYSIFIGEDKMGTDDEFNIINPKDLSEEIKSILQDNLTNIIAIGADDELPSIDFTYEDNYHTIYDRFVKLGFMKSEKFNSYCRHINNIDNSDDNLSFSL